MDAGGRRVVPNRARLTVAVIRAVLTSLVLGVAYFTVPLDRSTTAEGIILLIIWLIGVSALVVWQFRSVIRSQYPGARAIETLGTCLPLLLIGYAATYYLMAHASGKAFSIGLSRLDALYFTVTVFTTTGFGDITARSDAARAVVTSQMLIDLIFLGIVVRFITGAARFSIRRGSKADPGES